MKRQNYYPSRIGDQVKWLDNLATKLELYGQVLGLDPVKLGYAVNDARWTEYVMGKWLTAARAFSPASSGAVEEVASGSGTDPYVLPSFTPPYLSGAVPARPAGALVRLFDVIAVLKRSPGYTDAIGADMGVVGTEDASTHDRPKFTAEFRRGAGGVAVRLLFFKYGHMGTYIESRRAEGAWEFLAIDTESPYDDARPLLDAARPEVREYRMRFWDKGEPNGEWTDVAQATVSP